jgi:alpha-tubulin suppressor-like RCC1 family protein
VETVRAGKIGHRERANARHNHRISPIPFHPTHTGTGPLGTHDDASRLPVNPAGVRRWATLALGPSHAAGIDGDGAVYCWGRADHGQLGTPPGERRDAPARVAILKGWDVRSVACG